MPTRRTAFFISDRTGITSELLGHSLLTQFEGIDFKRITIPFVDDVDKARDVVRRIEEAAIGDVGRPVVFSTLIDAEVREAIQTDKALYLDFFNTFISPLEEELGVHSSHKVGRSHSVTDFSEYKRRIDAVNFAMSNDDGMQTKEYQDAEIILMGVSRSGKTPTCLYLALQYGLRAANYPLIPEDLQQTRLPARLMPFKHKIFGLTIAPERLTQIREERRPGSKYAALDNCRSEIREAEALMRQNNIPYLDTTSKSIEELASTIIHRLQLERRFY